ncbi:AT-rich binding protein-like [Linepithema humile]|uniref:AT-rich binding protein-like n=1 Tax=Linepithema humile TaxID=83485 RepID=UPI00351E31C5
MATKTGESGEEPATILNNTGIATTAGPLAESSTSSSSSSTATTTATTTTTTVPTVILTESTATSAGNLPLTGSQQQSLHQVQQQQQQPAQQQQQQQPAQQEQQQTHQKINLITDVAADDVAVGLQCGREETAARKEGLGVFYFVTNVLAHGYRQSLSCFGRSL